MLGTEFVALLNRIGWTQAAFARFIERTPRVVNDWAAGRRPVPRYAQLVLLTLIGVNGNDDILNRDLEGIKFEWWETLGLWPGVDRKTIAKARRTLAILYHPDIVGHDSSYMARINAAADIGNTQAAQ